MRRRHGVRLRAGLIMATKRAGIFTSTENQHRQASNDDDGINLTGSGTSAGYSTNQTEVSRSTLPSSNDADNDADWQTVIILRKRKKQASERKRSNAPAKHDAETDTDTKRPPSLKRKKACKLPPLLKDYFKIVPRPHRGLPLRNVITPALAIAIIESCKHQFSGEHFLLRIKPASNIAIFSTPHQGVAMKAPGILLLTINVTAHAVKAYRHRRRRHERSGARHTATHSNRDPAWQHADSPARSQTAAGPHNWRYSKCYAHVQRAHTTENRMLL
ncbi:hypothetical protein MTO96_030793 [Rhipicephalus appendiculatus]